MPQTEYQKHTKLSARTIRLTLLVFQNFVKVLSSYMYISSSEESSRRTSSEWHSTLRRIGETSCITTTSPSSSGCFCAMSTAMSNIRPTNYALYPTTNSPPSSSSLWKQSSWCLRTSIFVAVLHSGPQLSFTLAHDCPLSGILARHGWGRQSTLAPIPPLSYQRC